MDPYDDDNAKGPIVGTVREWFDEEGWGVLDAPEVPGGCFAHLTDVHRSNGMWTPTADALMTFTYEGPLGFKQDGYDYRAIEVWHGRQVGIPDL